MNTKGKRKLSFRILLLSGLVFLLLGTCTIVLLAYYQPTEVKNHQTFNLKTNDLHFNTESVYLTENSWLDLNITTDWPSTVRVKGYIQDSVLNLTDTQFNYNLKISQGDYYLVQVENKKGHFEGSNWIIEEIHISGDCTYRTPAPYTTPLNIIGGLAMIIGSLIIVFSVNSFFGSGLKLVLSIGLLSRIVVFVAMVIGSLLANTRWIEPNEGTWDLGIPLLNLFCRWDAGWYANIALNGYPIQSDPVSGNWAFFPLYPTLMRGFGSLLFGAFTPFQAVLIAGFVLSNVLFFAALTLFYKLSLKVLNNPQYAIAASAFFCFWPGAIFYSAVYSESLFMTFSLAAFYLLEKGKTAGSTALAFLAALTRSSGFFISAVFLYDGLQKKKYKTALMQVAIIFLPYLLFTLFGYLLTGAFLVRETANMQQFGGASFLIFFQILSLDAKYGAGYGLLYCFEFALILVPFIWLFMSKHFSLGEFFRFNSNPRGDLKYWFLSFGVFLSLLFYSFVFNLHRYSVLILPLYWVGANLLIKNRKTGVLFFTLIVINLVIGAILFGTWRYYW